ncbi:MAG: hypothetical protein Q3X00_02300, partial [Oscillospiraceae bacterium]|nr:hypothetical protein [Oscillospiraceae bacterium]
GKTMKTGYIWEMFLIKALLNKKNGGIYRKAAVLRGGRRAGRDTGRQKKRKKIAAPAVFFCK